MATYYLKNTSGSLVNVIDLGISLPDSQSLVIDSNGINAYLSSDMQASITSGDLILSTTDVGDNGGDMTVSDAIAALSITSRFDTDNPHSVTITQAIDADSSTDISITELNELTDGGTTSLHDHDDRYYTETELGASNTGTVAVHWDNITNTPNFGSLEWQAPAIGNLVGKGTASVMSSTVAEEGQFYLNEDDDHLYKYISGTWTDQGAPVIGDRVIFKDGPGEDDKIYEWDGSIWTPDPTPEDNWAIMVQDDGDGKAAQYIYDSTGAPPDWIKIADVDWGTHSSIGGRDEADSHPGTAITFNPTGTDLTSINVQDAIAEIATEQGTELDNIIFVAKNGVDVNANVTLGTIANPYLTIQAAIDSITGASSTNRYTVYVMPGDYDENVVLSKSFVYLAGPAQGGARITSSSGDTVTLSSTTEASTGLTNISVVSNSSTTTDNAILVTGNNPQLFNVDVHSPSGARTVYVNGAYTQTFRHVDLRSGEFRIDAGVVEFYDSRVIEALTSVTSGTLRVHNGDFSHNGGDAIEQTGGTVYLPSAKLTSGAGSDDYSQGGGTVYWGWVEYDQDKVDFQGTKYLLFPGIDLSVDTTSFTQTTINGDNVQKVLEQIDQHISNLYTNESNHRFDTTNPHEVTFTQVVAQDPGTDVTVAEMETLTGGSGSNADTLHSHDSDNVHYYNTESNMSSSNVQDAIDELDSRLDSAEFGFNQVLYVDKARVDTYTPDGTMAYPFKTIATALTTAGPGYIVRISGGTYTEDLTVPDKVSLEGIGTSKTIIKAASTGMTIGTGGPGSSVQMKGISLRTPITVNSGDGVVDFEGSYISAEGYMIIQTGDVRNANIGTTVPDTPALVMNSGATMFSGDSVYLESVGDGPTIVQNDGALALVGGLIQGSGTTDATIISNAGIVNLSHLNVVNTGGGLAIEINNGATTTPNALKSIQHVGGIETNTSVTIIEDIIGGDPSGTEATQILTPSTQNGYDDTSTNLGANNVQDAIQVLSSQITSFEMPSGPAFPTNPAPDGGDIFYRTDLNMTYQYDATRSEWLSMTQMFLDWGSNVADGKYLNIHGATATQTGYLMPYDGTIVSITAKIASGNQSKGVEIRRNNDRVTPLDTFSLTSGTYSSTTKNVEFSAGDYIQAFVPSAGTPAKDIVVMAVVVWRG